MKLKSLVQFLHLTTSINEAVPPSNHGKNCTVALRTAAKSAAGESARMSKKVSGRAHLRDAPSFSTSQSHGAKTALLSTVATPMRDGGPLLRQSSWPFKVQNAKGSNARSTGVVPSSVTLPAPAGVSLPSVADSSSSQPTPSNIFQKESK